MPNLIALVDQSDAVIGFQDKMDVHVKGLLHRAFSIIIFNTKGDMLIHRRADGKYHSPGLWTNACCSHLHQGSTMEESVNDRLLHEMGISCNLSHIFTFHYKVDFDGGLIENEIDHVYFGVFNDDPNPNASEVSEWRWINLFHLYNAINTNPNLYTYWFKYILQNYSDIINHYVQPLGT